MSTNSRVHHAPWIAFVSSIFLAGQLSVPVKAEGGIVIPIPLPPTQYANLPSNAAVNEPSTTGSLPNTSRLGARNIQGFPSDVTQGKITLRASAPTSCLPSDLRQVVADVAARFGPVSIESTHRTAGRNRRAGGASHSLHLSCRAIDFRIHARTRGVMAFLSSHPDVGGLKMYRNGIIHIDNGSRRSW